jgi:hypothetical protein
MKSYRITFEDRKEEVVQADGMVITPTGAIMFVEQPVLQRSSPNPQGEVIMVVAKYIKAERMEDLALA